MTEISKVERFFARTYAQAVSHPRFCAESRVHFMEYHKRYARFRGANMPRNELERQLSPIFEQAVITGRLSRLYQTAVNDRSSSYRIALLRHVLGAGEERLFERAKAHIDSLPKTPIPIPRARVLNDMADGLTGFGLWIRGVPAEGNYIREGLFVNNLRYTGLTPLARRQPYW